MTSVARATPVNSVLLLLMPLKSPVVSAGGYGESDWEELEEVGDRVRVTITFPVALALVVSVRESD